MTTPGGASATSDDPAADSAADRAADPAADPAADAAEGDVAGGLAPLVVVSGEATAEEVAALTAVVAVLGAAHASAVAAPPPRPVSQWAARSRQVRAAHRAGPGGWRASALPR